MACDAFCVTIFKGLCFHLSTLEMKRFQKSPFSSEFSGVLVWTIEEEVSINFVCLIPLSLVVKLEF